MKPETKREILIAREAYVAGAKDWSQQSAGPELATKKHYPLPKITRARVIEHNGVLFRVHARLIQYQSVSGIWNDYQSIVDTKRATIFHELFTNPTEEVEDEG